MTTLRNQFRSKKTNSNLMLKSFLKNTGKFNAVEYRICCYWLYEYMDLFV